MLTPYNIGESESILIIIFPYINQTYFKIELLKLDDEKIRIFKKMQYIYAIMANL